MTSEDLISLLLEKFFLNLSCFPRHTVFHINNKAQNLIEQQNKQYNIIIYNYNYHNY